MQNFGVTNKEYYGILRYFLEWSIGEIEVASYLNEQFATDNTENSSETFLEKEEIIRIIRQELQSQNFFGQRKEENKICYYCGKNGHILRFCRKRQYDLGGT